MSRENAQGTVGKRAVNVGEPPAKAGAPSSVLCETAGEVARPRIFPAYAMAVWAALCESMVFA